MLVLIVSASHAQSLREMLDRAKANYPLLKAKALESEAKEQDVRYAKSSSIPSLDAGYQVNYATYNNITGMATAQPFVPISGPPSGTNSSNAVFGSAAGLLMNWELFTFGQRKSKVASAQASLDYQKAEEINEQFQHQIRTADAYLNLLISYELVKVQERYLSRAQENLRIVRSLSKSGLRPGTDTALFRSDLIKARIDLLNYEKQWQLQQLQFSELLGERESLALKLDTLYFARLPLSPDTVEVNAHPLIVLSTGRVRISDYERRSLQKSLYPKLSLWGTAYGRGSGIRYDGYVSAQDGLSFSRYNYGAGIVLSVPILQFARTQHQIRSQTAQVEAAQERLNATNLQIKKQQELAKVTLANSLRIANESPAFFEASQYAYKGLLSRYNAGLLQYTDFVQAQYALTQSEAELRKAYVEAWKALLFMAAVNGDLDIFVNQL
jgi:outer membrane protein